MWPEKSALVMAARMPMATGAGHVPIKTATESSEFFFACAAASIPGRLRCETTEPIQRAQDRVRLKAA